MVINFRTAVYIDINTLSGCEFGHIRKPITLMAFCIWGYGITIQMDSMFILDISLYPWVSELMYWLSELTFWTVDLDTILLTLELELRPGLLI